jgi:hypothetical protein
MLRSSRQLKSNHLPAQSTQSVKPTNPVTNMPTNQTTSQVNSTQFNLIFPPYNQPTSPNQPNKQTS